ncbi:baseplate J/gp47 family protein [Aeromonas veronii]|uniref:baseplate J/gp47 family protein n=1 Tax=Aeromonas veronii TaxID=654 RepID=UPI00111A5DFF|nr:baseplate J/gp47 family protein [Aeromonas veronii]TNI12694.1 phage tail protein [Aeromonas veronii]
MPFPVPTVAQSTESQLRDIKNALPNEEVDTSSDSDYAVRANAVSGVADGLYAHQGWMVRQIFPDTADPEYLELHCRQRNVFRKKATASSSVAAITGTPGSILPAGSDMRGDGVSVVTTYSCLLDEDGNGVAPVKSITAGAQTNTLKPLAATLVSPPDGINSAVTVAPLTGGTDKESNESLLARYLDILRRPPAGGNKYDYQRWALEVDGVTSAYVAPLRRGLGTVDVAITSNDDLPPQALIDSVFAHIEDVRPVTAKDTLVLAPTKVVVDVVVRIATSGMTIDQITPQVVATITDFITRLAPGRPLVISQLETQISLITGVADRDVVNPVQNVPAVIDAHTWEWLRPGTITVEQMS